MKKLSYLLASVMLVAMTLASCKSSNKPAADASAQDSIPEVLKDVAGIEKFQTKLDYSKAENWVERPTEATKPVDVFFIYPTVTGFRNPVQICEVTDSEMVAGAKFVRQVQTSVFEESCNIFMPFYRQISMPKPGTDYRFVTNYLSGFDATDALDYFLTHLNQGRPFILAGHSQGSSTLLNLLENYMTKHPEALSRMIAAYPIGFAKNATLAPNGLSINPINWKRDDTYAPAKDNLGSLDEMTGRVIVPGIVDARVDTIRGSVVVTTAAAKPFAISEKEAVPLFGPECYHRNDYGFFFNNLKQNIADRIKAFMENK